MSKILKSHFIERWLTTKKKASGNIDGHNKSHCLQRKSNVLETIHEGQEGQETPDVPYKLAECSSFYMPWAQQRLPIPIHWFLSAVCSIGEMKSLLVLSSKELLELAKESPVFNVPLAWKLHALSMSLRVNMIALEDNGTREMFESLQELYGKQLDDLRYKQKKQELEDSLMSLPKTNKIADGLLCFQSQVLMDITVRLAAWNSLSNNHLLELLPTLETCLAQAEGYLEPPEENEGILEAYTKSWTSGCLDRAYTRGSIAFILALHHLNSFLFKSETLEKLKLRNKLTKALLRSCSHKQHSDGMLIQLVQYKLPPSQDPLRPLELKQRLVVLNEACEGNSSLLAVIDNLKSALER
ncbi:hypothetical protein HPP92_024002 [Vanilla planifolia]|uniref:RPAP1/MINIYO-like TPR repeats domain-containing protein n=1 Tax=Vanilla planifolia TaxID=51239 RepID=A0A835PLN0_VANPL|nr:hypothetical protein HPP92_024002 [Vanilla planifolia]